MCNNASATRKEDSASVGQAMNVTLLNERPLHLNLPDPRQIRRAWPSLVRKISASQLSSIKGSVNALLPPCKFYSVAEDSTPALGTNMRSVIASKAQVAAASGHLRTELPCSPACRLPPRVTPMSGSSNSGLGFKEMEKAHLVFVGFVVMLDPLRNGVADAVVLLQSGGVQVAVITGDVEERRCRAGWTLRKEAADAILMDDNVLPTIEDGSCKKSRFKNYSSAPQWWFVLITLRMMFGLSNHSNPFIIMAILTLPF
ncbi:hypothetical protein EDB89DRAFT_1905506 [Lactarius sanguifluus]|nr:hypothetical protein EDB89DRAFT_1905506 [Lactarius sanguifluus]